MFITFYFTRFNPIENCFGALKRKMMEVELKCRAKFRHIVLSKRVMEVMFNFSR